MKVKGFSILVIIIISIGLSGCLSLMDDILEESQNTSNTNDIGGREAYDEAVSLMDQNQPYEAIDKLNEALDAGYPEDIIYNDMCLAYNQAGDYEAGVHFIELAHKIAPDSSVQYSNHGNSLYGLARYQEAHEKYMKAIELDESNPYGFYGAYSTFYMFGNNEDATAMLETYMEKMPDDYEAGIELVGLYMENGDVMKAYSEAERLDLLIPDNFDILDSKGYVLEFVESRDNVEAYYNDLQNRFPDEYDAWINLPMYYHDVGLYNESIAALEVVIETFPDETEAYVGMSASYSMLGDFDKAVMYSEMAMELNPSAENMNAHGNTLFDQSSYPEAVDYYLMAEAEKTEGDETYWSNIVYAYYLGHRYQKCIDYGLSIMDEIVYSNEIPVIVAYAYTEKCNYTKAIEYLEFAIELGMPQESLNYDIAENYYYMGDYDNARVYLDLCLEENLDDYDARYLLETLELKESGSENIIRSIVSDYYLYADYTGINPVDTSTFKDLDYEASETLFYELVEPDDMYSFYIYGDTYDYVMYDESSSIDFEIVDANTILANIYFFGEQTDDLFIEYIDEVENPEDKNLIINMMGNGGGLTYSAVNILDTLLPSVTVCSLIDREGYSYPYYTNESHIDFNHIYVLIDQDSASASELTTLGLMTFHRDVTVIGQNSHGKGVGQIFFEEPNKNAAYFVVNHYWNVREENIMGVGIAPDVLIESPSLEACLTYILELD